MTQQNREILPPSPGDALWSAWEQSAQVPLVIAAGYWNAWVKMLCPLDQRSAHLHGVHPLAVPEPLEVDPAPGLFA